MTARKNTAKSIQQQEFSNPLSSKVHAYCQPSEEGGRNIRISGQSPGNIFRQVGQVHDMGGQRVVACHGFSIGCQYEYRSYSLANILTRLLLQIAVERFYSTRKSSSVVAAAKGFSSIFDFGSFFIHEAFTRRW